MTAPLVDRQSVIAKTRPYSRIAVIGAGAWGTALAAVARRAGREVTIWGRDPEVVRSLNEENRNNRYLPDIDLPAGMKATTDLGEALGPNGARDGAEWRVHFHVPVFLETLPEFGTTQAFLKEILHIHRAAPVSRHLEVETYTWDVLPPDLVAGSVEDAVTRELRWVLAELGQ